MEKSKIMESVDSFPAMPGAATKALRVLDDPEVASDQIEEIFRYDPGLTAHILKMTNSAYFGLPMKVGSLRQAIGLLGLRRLKELVLATCVTGVMDKQVPGYELSPGELWRHSIGVSVAAEGLAKELKLPEIQEIFTTALLHDLGKLVMGRFVEKEMKAIEEIASQGVPFQSAEQRVLGTDHAEIGALMLEKWSLPPEIVSAVRWHHDPDAAEDRNALTDIVHVSDVMCLMIGIGIGREGLQHEPSTSAIARLGLKTGLLEEVASRTLEWVNEMSEILDLGENG